MSAVAETAKDEANAPEENAELPRTVKKICGVCEVEPPKYKCARCELPYCSVACATTHRATHPAEDPPKPKAPTPPPEPEPQTNGRPGTVGGAKSANPFAVLEESESLKELFKRYPTLRSQLNDIYAFTLPEGERNLEGNQYAQSANNHYGSNSSDRGRGGRYMRGGHRGHNRSQWTPEAGIKDSIEVFGRAKEDHGKAGEGIREFEALVLKLLDTDDRDVAQLVKDEMQDENTRLIQQLLNGES